MRGLQGLSKAPTYFWNSRRTCACTGLWTYAGKTCKGLQPMDDFEDLHKQEVKANKAEL